MTLSHATLVPVNDSGAQVFRRPASTLPGSSEEADEMRKRSVVISGHRTSVSLETAFWAGLKEIADSRGISVNRLVETIDAARATNLSSAIRVFVLKCFRNHEAEPGLSAT